MNIYEFADMIKKNIVFTRYANQNGRISVHFEYSETLTRGVLCSKYGDGETPEKAINDYTTKIMGETLVFRAMSDNRQEYEVPYLENI